MDTDKKVTPAHYHDEVLRRLVEACGSLPLQLSVGGGGVTGTHTQTYDDAVIVNRHDLGYAIEAMRRENAAATVGMLAERAAVKEGDEKHA